MDVGAVYDSYEVWTNLTGRASHGTHVCGLVAAAKQTNDDVTASEAVAAGAILSLLVLSGAKPYCCSQALSLRSWPWLMRKEGFLTAPKA